MNDFVIIIPVSELSEDCRRFTELCIANGDDVIITYVGNDDLDIPMEAQILHYPRQGIGDAVRKAIAHVRDNTEYKHILLISDPTADAFSMLESVLKKHAGEEEELTVCSFGKYAGDNILSRAGRFITNMAYRIISGQKLDDLQPQIRCFSRDIFDRIVSVHGRGEDFFVNMLVALPLDNISVCALQGEDNGDYTRNRIRFLKLIGLLFPYAFVSRIVKFGLSSLLAFVIDYFTLEIVHFYLSGTSMAAPAVTTVSQVIARVVSSITNFFINYAVVFKTKGKLLASAAKYFSTVCIILLAQMGIMAVLDSVLHLNILYTPIIVQCTTFFINYVIQRKLVYKR